MVPLDFVGKTITGGVYLEGHGDVVSRLITPITHIITQIIPASPLLTFLLSPHDPPSRAYVGEGIAFLWPEVPDVTSARIRDVFRPRPRSFRDHEKLLCPDSRSADYLLDVLLIRILILHWGREEKGASGNAKNACQ